MKYSKNALEDAVEAEIQNFDLKYSSGNLILWVNLSVHCLSICWFLSMIHYKCLHSLKSHPIFISESFSLSLAVLYKFRLKKKRLSCASLLLKAVILWVSRGISSQRGFSVHFLSYHDCRSSGISWCDTSLRTFQWLLYIFSLLYMYSVMAHIDFQGCGACSFCGDFLSLFLFLPCMCAIAVYKSPSIIK